MAEQATQDRQSTAQPPPLPAKYTRAARKTRVGEVISDRMNKTIVVRTITRVPHPKFGKIVKQIRRFYAHDEENKAKTGDTVRIMETLAVDGGAPEINFMVQLRSRLEVADNTGARMATMIGVIGKATLYAGIGDVITANVKEASATGTVKKGEVVRAV